MVGGLTVAVVGATLLFVSFLTDGPATNDSVRPGVEAFPVEFTRVTADTIGVEPGRFIGPTWGDFDNDGRVDLVRVDQSEGGRLYHDRNVGDGCFERVTGSFPIKDTASLVGVFTADMDNDGDLDLFFTADEMSTNRFFRNDGTGSFVEVTEGHWVNTPSSSQGAAWGDYDGDGWIDLFVANSGLDHDQLEANFLYHNRGDGTMESVQTRVHGNRERQSRRHLDGL